MPSYPGRNNRARCQRGRSNETVTQLNREGARARTHRSCNCNRQVLAWKQCLQLCRDQRVCSVTHIYLTRPPSSSWCVPACLPACAVRSAQPACFSQSAPVTSRLYEVIHALGIRSVRCQPEPAGCYCCCLPGLLAASELSSSSSSCSSSLSSSIT